MSTMHVMSPANLSNMIDTEGKKLNGAPFTVKSKKTGKDYTFKISQVTFNGVNYIHVKTEREYLKFTYTGYFREGNIVRRNKETNQLAVIDTPAAQAIAWVLRQLFAKKYETLSESVEVFHLGKCLKCGKTLTDSDSIQYGFGPICRAV